MGKNLQSVLVGKRTGFRQMAYTWRDAALYALAVGAGEKDLQYTYEREMKALPTFGVLPCWGAVNISPELPRPAPAALFANEFIRGAGSPLHMEHELRMFRPIDPIQRSFIFQDVITNVYDRGAGKGVIIETRADVYDKAGNLICTNTAGTLFRQGGGFGRTPMPKSAVCIPDRAPDAVLDDSISATQNVLYRLTGDTDLVHVDPGFARDQGYDKVFMQGLCSFGFACRMAIQTLIPGMPERTSRLAAQMRSILYPNTPVRLHLWQTAPNQAYFRLIDQTSDRAVLDRGVFEWS